MGFASRDSDCDVRFLYVHRRDVVEEPIADDLDVSGWELRKAPRLLRKSNPPLLEWLKSPVVYRHDPVFAAEFAAALLRALIRNHHGVRNREHFLG